MASVPPNGVLKINGPLTGPLTCNTTGGSNIVLGLNDSWEGLRVNAGELIKADPFNKMARKLVTLELAIREVARRAGMSMEETEAMLSACQKSVDVSEEMMKE